MFSVTLFIAIALVAISLSCQAQEDAKNNTETISTDLMSFVGIKYKLVSNDLDFAKVLEELGVNFLRIMEIMLSSPDLELTWDAYEDKYTLSEKYTFFNATDTFQIGSRFNRTTADGRNIWDTFTLDPNNKYGVTLIESQEQPGKPPLVIEREFTHQFVVFKMTLEETVSYRLFAIVNT